MSEFDSCNMTVCVGAVVLHGQRALFVRQAAGHSLAGQWSIPWGMLERGETPEEAILREICEESGIQARIDGLLGYQNLHTPGWIGIIFLCRHTGGEPVPDGLETDRAAYFTGVQMDAFDEPFEPWCAWLARRVLAKNYRLIPLESDNPYHPLSACF